MNEYGYTDTSEIGLGRFNLKKAFKKLNPINVLKQSTKALKKVNKKINPVAMLKMPLQPLMKKSTKKTVAPQPLPEITPEQFNSMSPVMQQQYADAIVTNPAYAATIAQNPVYAQSVAQNMTPYYPGYISPQPMQPYTPTYAQPSGGDGWASQGDPSYNPGGDNLEYNDDQYSGYDDSDYQENVEHDSQIEQGNDSAPDDMAPEDGLGFVWFTALAQAIGKGVQKLKKNKAVKKAKDAAKKSLAQSLTEKDKQTDAKYNGGRGFAVTPLTAGLAIAGLGAVLFFVTRRRGR